MPINPRDNSISVGLDAIQKNREATFNYWSELKRATQIASIIARGAAMVGAVFYSAANAVAQLKS
jgi:hypothetical protein